MGSQLLVKQDVEAVNLKAYISVFVASRVRWRDLRFVSDTCFNNNIFDSIKDLIIVNAVFRKPVS